MTDETPSPAPQSRRRKKTPPQQGPWPIAVAMKVLERYGVSTLALGALGWYAATYMVNPLVAAAKASMESVSEKVGKIEEVFRESERLERDQSARATAAIETIRTEISAHRQQAVELRDGLLSKILDAQSKQFSEHQGDMERLFRESLRREDQCELPGPAPGVFVGPEGAKPGKGGGG